MLYFFDPVLEDFSSFLSERKTVNESLLFRLVARPIATFTFMWRAQGVGGGRREEGEGASQPHVQYAYSENEHQGVLHPSATLSTYLLLYNVSPWRFSAVHVFPTFRRTYLGHSEPPGSTLPQLTLCPSLSLAMTSQVDSRVPRVHIYGIYTPRLRAQRIAPTSSSFPRLFRDSLSTEVAHSLLRKDRKKYVHIYIFVIYRYLRKLYTCIGIYGFLMYGKAV